MTTQPHEPMLSDTMPIETPEQLKREIEKCIDFVMHVAPRERAPESGRGAKAREHLAMQLMMAELAGLRSALFRVNDHIETLRRKRQAVVGPQLSLEDWCRRAYAQLMYAFMLRATVDWYMWGGGWDVIERAPEEVKPVLPCYPNWRALPAWVRWWTIDGDGTIRGWHLKPMGWVEKRVWMLGAHGPVQKGLPTEMILGYVGTKDEPQAISDWYVTLHRRPEAMESPEPEPVEEPKVKAKRKRKKKEAKA